MRILMLLLLVCVWCPSCSALASDMPLPPQHITGPLPGHMAYQHVVQLLHIWEQEAPELVMVAPIGTSQKGVPIYALRLTNERIDVKYKSRVLIAMSIHGNEPLASAVGMGWAGYILSHYGRRDHEYLNELVNKREVYLIPVVSPDSFPFSRHVDGVDPNRDFNKNPACAPVECLKRLAYQMKFSAVISGHTSGRVLLYPYGDTYDKCPHDAQYRALLNDMRRWSGYGVGRLCNVYPYLIHGVEDDWYYRNFGACAITYEFGTSASHNREPTYEAVRTEFDRTYMSAIHFICFGPSALYGVTR